MEIFSLDYDDVLKSYYLTGTVSYQYALTNLFPLINKVEFQRKLQDIHFYNRLKEDIIRGCIMPPITIAFISNQFNDKHNCSRELLESYISQNISTAYILDGIQRLNTLNRASLESDLNLSRKLYLNIIISSSEDYLIYRMITLNNGQKPMSPRHQIEILTQNLFDFPRFNNICIQTEKESSNGKKANTIKYSDITKSYLAFLTNNVNNENSKIISEEMDKIIVNRIMETGLPDDKAFFNYLSLIDNYCADKDVLGWFCQSNNLIGAIVGMKNKYDKMVEYSVKQIAFMINTFETNFKTMVNKSKINMGKIRREYVCMLFKRIVDTVNMTDSEMKEFIVSLE